jgi:hypothetical protein
MDFNVHENWENHVVIAKSQTGRGATGAAKSKESIALLKINNS